MKRIITILCAITLIIGNLFYGVTPLVKASDENTLTIHYQRTDKKYDNWDLWLWDKTGNGEGSAVAATYQDDFGLIFESKVKNNNQYGFILRMNDWSSKNCGEDQFIDIKGNTEIWVLQDECKVYTKNPTTLGGERKPLGAVDKPVATDQNAAAKLYVHYYRFDQNYEGWNIWSWPKGGEGKAYEFSKSDKYGVVAEINLDKLGDNGEVGFIIRLNEWASKDIDSDRFIQFKETDKVNGKYEKHIYLVQADSKVYLNEGEVTKTPGIDNATFTTTKQIELYLQGGSIDTKDIVVKDGDKLVAIESITAKDKKITINLKDSITMGNQYNISKKGYKGPKEITYNGLFSSKEFEEQFYYEGDDLGSTYTKDSTKFRVWAPTASKVSVKFYADGDYRKDNLVRTVDMTKDVKGTWVLEEKGDLEGTYYTYEVHVAGAINEAVDPYARAVGINGHRAMVIDLSKTNPNGFGSSKPYFSGNYVDAIIYELHIRDLSTSDTSGITNKGKYLGVIESGTKSPNGLSTGLDHMKELGITHLHLLPSFDYRSIDETKLEQNAFNWGYDPYNYNVPEGSYSSDPSDGHVRINEYKQMVQGLHDNGIRVIMDVVYNHTGASADSHFNKIVPGYYYRMNSNGAFSNGSGCGNETASERAMMRKYIVDSVKYWATEYNVDGFRFDLMALHDIETMNLVKEELNKIDPSIIIYGEGWTGGTSPLPDSEKALKDRVSKMPGVAVFSDDLRDGVKGSVFNKTEAGFVSGNYANSAKVRFGITGGALVKGVPNLYEVLSPNQTINYVSAHDNNTLWDKLMLSTDVSDEIRIQMDKMANAIVLTSQGVPFLHAGEEMLRTKGGNENSYNASDKVNQIDWTWKEKNQAVFEYYKGLIELRKAHPEFRLNDNKIIQEKLSFLQTERGVIGYTIKTGEKTNTVVVFNATDKTQEIVLPKGNYSILVNGEKAGTKSLGVVANTLKAKPYSSYVLVTNASNYTLPLIIGSVVVIGLLGLVVFLLKRKNK